MKCAILLSLFGLISFVGKTQEGTLDTSNLPVEVQYISLRPALWEEKALIEEVNEKRNQGGLVLVYYKNTSDKPVPLREWYLNLRESGHFLLAGDVAWDRRYTSVLMPGQTTVQEINGVSQDFQLGKKADFALLGSNWKPVAYQPSVFEPEKLRVSSIVFDETLTTATIHIRSFVADEVGIDSLSFEGKTPSQAILSSNVLEGNGHIIARVKLNSPFKPGELALLRIETVSNGKRQAIYSHRNAYADYFPNGTWGIEERQYQDAKKHHLNTMVKGGSSKDPFFTKDYQTTGIKAMPHTGIYPNIDMIRDLENHPAVAVWYIHDEPDWHYTPQLLMGSHEMTKKYSTRKPTLITLCRNVKFFEFGFIPDIPCHDHYSVTAPTSSKWPYVYGTRLEETGYYTANLKYAAEPKPIWVWSQGVHLWDERPKMPIPTPDELGAQLYFNLSRGAKGNLWFTFMEEAGKHFPATKKALQEYGRLVKTLEKDLPGSDPYHGQISAPGKTDVASLITEDKMILFITNTNYVISDSAYQWSTGKDIKVNIALPKWFKAIDAFELSPTSGIRPAQWKAKDNIIELELNELKMGRVFIISMDKQARKQYENRFKELLLIENSQ